MGNALTGELWLPVVGFEGSYEVSDLGGVRSVDRPSAGRRLPGRVLKQHLSKQDGRLRVSLSVDGVVTHHLVAHLVASAFIGPRPVGQVVRHWNDDRRDNRKSNLLYGTASDNAQDCLRNGHNSSATKTCCPRGHKLIDPNLVAGREGRTCLACARARSWVKAHPEDEFEEQADLYYAAIMSGQSIDGRVAPIDVNRAKTECKRGHPLEGTNLKIVVRPTKTFRNCRSCVRAVEAARRAARRGEAVDIQALADHLYLTCYSLRDTA